MTRHLCKVALTLIALSSAAACRPSAPPPAAGPLVTADTWAVVDGREITRQDVDKAFKRMQDPQQTLSEEEAMTAKLGLLDNLILQDLLLAKARTLKVTVPDSELDTAFNDAKKNIPDEAFQQELKQRGLTADDMRDGLRRELLTQKVIEQEISSKVTVSDQEVTDFFNANRSQFNLAEESYHIAQIVVTPVGESEPANSTGDDATTPQAAAAKVQMLMQRLKEGASFRDLAASYSEDPQSAPRGGDLGLVPISRLKQAPPQLRDAVLNKTPGSVNVASANGAYTLVLVVAHEPAGQRDLSTPGVKDRIADNIKARREQLLRSAYLTAVRSDAKIVNHLAHRLLESKSAVPTLQPSAPKK
jgi:peptidyl-prolyl cis-trans isomerase SurA